MKTADRDRLQSYLERTLQCPDLVIEAPARVAGPVQLRVGSNVLGTVDQVDDDGERSWVVTLIVLEEDLAG